MRKSVVFTILGVFSTLSTIEAAAATLTCEAFCNRRGSKSAWSSYGQMTATGTTKKEALADLLQKCSDQGKYLAFVSSNSDVNNPAITYSENAFEQTPAARSLQMKYAARSLCKAK